MTEVWWKNPVAWHHDWGLILEPCGLGTWLWFDRRNLWTGNMTEVWWWNPVHWEHDWVLIQEPRGLGTWHWFHSGTLFPGNMTEVWWLNPVAWQHDRGLIVEPSGLGTWLRLNGGTLWPGNRNEVWFWIPVACNTVSGCLAYKVTAITAAIHRTHFLETNDHLFDCKQLGQNLLIRVKTKATNLRTPSIDILRKHLWVINKNTSFVSHFRIYKAFSHIPPIINILAECLRLLPVKDTNCTCWCTVHLNLSCCNSYFNKICWNCGSQFWLHTRGATE